jgi:hypothetical protein
MRQWLINPKDLCNKHLLGEHCEHHMFIGTIKKRKSITGFLNKNLLEPKSLYKRHEELKKEMIRRGMNHYSELEQINLNEYLTKEELECRINKQLSIQDLKNRCSNCFKEK